MTAEKILKESYSTKPDIDNPYKLYWSEDVVQAMQEYAKMKCEELLEIVTKEASKFYIKSNIPHYARLDKDSILNAVDLETFCS